MGKTPYSDNYTKLGPRLSQDKGLPVIPDSHTMTLSNRPADKITGGNAVFRTDSDVPDEAAYELFSLHFESDDLMAKFVQEILNRIGRETDKIRVGIGAVNIEKTLFNEVKGELEPDRFGYTVRDL